jgi:HD-GYP domain-containing protein (c-di-GMP phosphodiesterase class II)
MEGWIKIHRKILDWEWFGKAEMVKLLIMFVCKANIEDREWQGMLVKRGQFVTSLDKLSVESGFSKQKIRTCLKRFENTQEITIKTTNKYSIVTICNYDDYQVVEDDNQHAEQQTNNIQTTNQQQQLKNIKNIYKETTTKVVAKKSLSLSLSKNLEKRSKSFYDSLIPFVSVYGKETVRAFYNYWTEPNRSKTKMRFELEKTWDVERRLNTWVSRDKIKSNANGTDKRRGFEVSATSAEDYKTSF